MVSPELTDFVMLTDIALKNAKPKDRVKKLSDAQGLQLWVMPNGAKLWRYAFRFAGKQKLLALGHYPTVSLQEARAKHSEAKSALLSGIDPTHRRKIEKYAGKVSQTNTFKSVAAEWLAKNEREGRARTTLIKNNWLLEFAYPVLGDRPIAEIKAPEILIVLQKVEARGTLETARRLRGIIGTVFRHAIATAKAETDPTFPLRNALTTPKVVHRAAITETEHVAELLKAIDGYAGHASTKSALKIAPHVFVRPGELRHMEWIEVALDDATWTIPAHKTKMRRPLVVPLSRQVVELLKQQFVISGDGKLVFPCARTVHRPLSENSLNAALRRMGYSKDEMTAHGFRAMASTLLNESGKWHADAIERQLGHVESDDVRRAYARGEHWPERVRMMQWWSDHLDQLGAKTIKKYAA